MWVDADMLPTFSATVGAAGPEGDVFGGDRLGEGKRSSVAADAQVAKRLCVDEAGALGHRSMEQLA